MHWLDILLLIVLGVATVWGAWSGLLWHVARVVSFIAAIYACVYFHEPVAAWLGEQVTGIEGVGLHVLTYVVTFVGVIALFYTGTWLLERWVKAAELKKYDRICGAVVGGLEAALVCGAILWGLNHYATRAVEPTFKECHVAPVLIQGTDYVLVAIPEEYKEQFRESKAEVEKRAKEEAEKQAIEAGKRALEEAENSLKEKSGNRPAQQSQAPPEDPKKKRDEEILRLINGTDKK